MSVEDRGRGYCALCRAKEIKLFGVEAFAAGEITDEQHEEACKKAKCKHPAFYDPEEDE